MRVSSNNQSLLSLNTTYTTQWKCMRVGVQRQQTLLVTTELVIWRYANAFIFTKQSELDFGIALVYTVYPKSVYNHAPYLIH
jgi:hypothetical protein